MLTRRSFLAGAGAAPAIAKAGPARPNVIVVLTDDQGYGDLGCHGHPFLKTPHLDRLHGESVRFTQFHSSPMCTPTRGSLLTGQAPLRNGAMATSCGRSQLREGIPTMAEIFRDAGYATGLFGKWHLGYGHPHRPMDRGFENSDYFLGFGLTGAGDFWDNDYLNPRYYHNGTERRGAGYCNDLWFNLAMDWMNTQRRSRQPFLCYLPTNIPHFQEWVDFSFSKVYEGEAKAAAPYFGMVANLDENMGRLDGFLAKSGLRENTIVVFMSDNGAVVGWKIYNAGMRGHKTQLYDGGHRVPCFLRWPGGAAKPGRDVTAQTRVEDVLPTLADLCGVRRPAEAQWDGMSVANAVRSEKGAVAPRMFTLQYYQNSVKRGDACVIWERWRLIREKELYDVAADPAQARNVIAERPEVAGKMRAHYDEWWGSVEAGVNDLVPSHVGASQEPTAMLCSSEWQDVRCDGKESVRNAAGGPRGGPWNVMVERDGEYEIELRRWPREANAALADGQPAFRGAYGTLAEGKALPIAKARLTVAGETAEGEAAAGRKKVTFRRRLTKGRTQMQGWFQDAEGRDLCGAYFAYVRVCRAT